MGALTRAEMEQVIAEGGSMIMPAPDGQHRIVSRVEDLPSAADLAEGNTAAEDAVLHANEAQIAALLAQQKQLERARERRLAVDAKKADAESEGNAKPNLGQPGEEQPKGEEPGEHITGDPHGGGATGIEADSEGAKEEGDDGSSKRANKKSA